MRFPSLLPDQEAMIVFNKKPFTDVFKIDVLKISQYSQEKPVLEYLFNKVAGVQNLNLITKQRYFPVSIAKFLRKTYFTANPRWLLLFFFSALAKMTFYTQRYIWSIRINVLFWFFQTNYFLFFNNMIFYWKMPLLVKLTAGLLRISRFTVPGSWSTGPQR